MTAPAQTAKPRRARSPRRAVAFSSSLPPRFGVHVTVVVAMVIVAVIMVVHHLLGYVWKQFARGRRRGADPFHAAALACGFAQIVEGEQRGVLRHLEALRQRGKDQLAHLAPVPSVAQGGDLGELLAALEQRPQRR